MEFLLGFLVAAFICRPTGFVYFDTEDEAMAYVNRKQWMVWRRYVVRNVGTNWIVGYVTPVSIIQSRL